MKKEYMKPSIEVEVYSLSASIAANCGNIISMGPPDILKGEEGCTEFGGMFPGLNSITSVQRTSFYADGGGMTNCDCYYSAGGQGYFTS